MENKIKDYGFVYAVKTYTIHIKLKGNDEKENWKCYTRQVRYLDFDRFDGEIFGREMHKEFVANNHEEVLQQIEATLNKEHKGDYTIELDKSF